MFGILRHKRNSFGRRFAVLFAAFALSLQSLVPFAQAMPASGAGSGGTYIVICTALGIQTIPDPNAPPPVDNRPACPVCVAHALGGALLAPEPLTLEPILFSETADFASASSQRVDGQAPVAPSNRDPPIV